MVQDTAAAAAARKNIDLSGNESVRLHQGWKNPGFHVFGFSVQRKPDTKFRPRIKHPIQHSPCHIVSARGQRDVKLKKHY